MNKLRDICQNKHNYVVGYHWVFQSRIQAVLDSYSVDIVIDNHKFIWLHHERQKHVSAHLNKRVQVKMPHRRMLFDFFCSEPFLKANWNGVGNFLWAFHRLKRFIYAWMNILQEFVYIVASFEYEIWIISRKIEFAICSNVQKLICCSIC